MRRRDRSRAAMLWACLLLPVAALDVFARGHRPLTPRGRSRSPAAAARRASSARTPRRATPGCIRGQLVSASLALAPDLVLRERDAAAEAAALAPSRPGRRSSRRTVCLAPPDAVLAEIGGSLRLFGGLPRLVARLCRRRARRGLRAARRARAHARRRARSSRVRGRDALLRDPHALPDALAPLPLALCRRRSRARSRRSRPPASRTFGAGGRAAARRAGAARCGGALVGAARSRARRAVPIRARRSCRRRVTRESSTCRRRSPTSRRSRSRRTGSCTSSRPGSPAADWASLRLSLALAHERYLGSDAASRATDSSASRSRAPARAPAHLIAVLRERLARVALPAPVEAITLASDETAPLAGRNLGLLPGDEADAALVPLRRSPARAAGRRRGDARRAACRASARARAARSRIAMPHVAHAIRVPLAATAPRPLWLLAEPQPLGASAGAQPWVLQRRARAHRIGLVGRRRCAPRLLRRRNAARRNGRGSIAITATAPTTANGSCTGCLRSAAGRPQMPAYHW